MRDIDQQELRRYIRKNSLLIAIVSVFFTFILVLSDYLNQGPMFKLIILSLSVFVILLILSRAYRNRNISFISDSMKIRPYRITEELGKELETIPENSLVYTHFPGRYGDILYLLVILGSGIFIINVCYTKGSFSIKNNEFFLDNAKPKRDILTVALKNKVWLEEEIRKNLKVDVNVFSLIVFINSDINGVFELNNVYLMNRESLANFLKAKRDFRINMKDISNLLKKIIEKYSFKE
ncbi:hypothetical protein TDSAC_0421 [Thermodesulfobium acidiphilum]|uniref:Nuclease-related domain-containing protein n=1 Tax=Thermodesulfobium acidiphilum TaxID=1794699 RepID=A0A2R4VZ36_THEAF|nr:hypothetical protein [Thermodesulfobium acidiphilum]AWB09797.1 hypothetical protein TDSAC_0421 [Thermodesulfobium acidiphilum]PMP85145.1 MAG: hypothetical protein C0174_05350 [Thermodesulfobium narugense]